MKVLFGSLGSPNILKSKNLKRYNGSVEGYNYIWILARNPSIDHLYIASQDWEGLSPLEKADLDPRNIIINCYENYKKSASSHTVLFEYLKNIQIDFALCKLGYAWGKNSLPDIIFNPEGGMYECQEQNAYSSNLIYFLNNTRTPYFMLCPDPRQVKAQVPVKWNKVKFLTSEPVIHRYDTIHKPIEIMSQINMEVNLLSVKELAKTAAEQIFTVTPIPLRYRGTDLITSIFYDKIKIPDNKKYRMNIGMMQGINLEDNSYRFNCLKDWVLKFPFNKDVGVYGSKDNKTENWDEEFVKQYPLNFKGKRDYKDLDDILLNTRYTFVIGIGPHWSTAKWAENLILGCIPFVHPDYDTQYNSIPKGSILRVKSPEELYERIEYFDNHNTERIDLVHSLIQELIIERDVKNGLNFIRHLNDALEPLNIVLQEKVESTLIRKKPHTLF